MQTTLLVVEDDEYVRDSLERLLRHQGYRVLTAPHGAAALDVLRREAVHLVLTDLRVEPVDGLELLAHIRASSLSTAVIVLTGYGTLDTAIRALRYQADDYLLKPCEPAVLLERVQAALARRRMLAESRKANDSVQSCASSATITSATTPGDIPGKLCDSCGGMPACGGRHFCDDGGLAPCTQRGAARKRPSSRGREQGGSGIRGRAGLGATGAGRPLGPLRNAGRQRG